MIDSVFRHLAAALVKQPWSRFDLAPGGFALVTLHRPALVDDPQLLGRTIDAVSELARLMPLVFPVHPRTQARLAATGVDLAALRKKGVMICSPLGYLEFLGLEAKAAFVLTDSGGVQEETSALGIRCFTLRDTTERPVTVDLGTNTVLGVDPDAIRAIPDLLADQRTSNREIPLWDGKAGERAAEV